MSSGPDDTICAIATPIGEGGIGILRVSGSRAIDVVCDLVNLRSGKSLPSVKSHTLYHADILIPRENQALQTVDAGVTEGVHRQPLDDALVAVMRAPRSYTAEDVVEIHCHGGALLMEILLAALLRHGARLAEPGEFTKRAFLNGRLDLAQAEAVLDTIRAKTSLSLQLAQAQLRGALSSVIDQLREALIGLLAHVEAAIDFAEEDIAFVGNQELMEGLKRIIDQLACLVDRAREGRILREGARVAITGRPNVGKSSLMNALLRTDRAIVTAIPGTTRDVLEEVVNIRGLPVRLFDTAGIRETSDPIEQEGVRRSLSIRDQAQLVLVVLDGSQPLTAEDLRLLEDSRKQRRVIVVNKSDLPGQMSETDLAPMISDERPVAVIQLSVKTEAGLDDLRDRMRSALVGSDLEANEGVLVTNVRHQRALDRAKEALEHALDSVSQKLSDEFVAMDLRVAADALGEVTGTISTDDILERVFSEFCIGK